MQDDASVKIDSLHTRVGRIDAKIEAILAKIASIDESIKSITSNASVQTPKVWGEEGSETSQREEWVQETTTRERQVLGVLFNYGILSYREIAGYLGITPITVKSIVNRMLEDKEKEKLLVKHRDGRELKVGLAPEVEQRILAKQKKKQAAAA